MDIIDIKIIMGNDWTIKKLNKTDDITFAIGILRERRNKLTNVYSPLSQKIAKAIQTLDRIRG